MTSIVRYGIVLALLFSLSGCYINEKGNICSLTMSRMYCDKEAYAALMYPKLPIESWARNETSNETRLKDWGVCGGDSSGGYGLASLPNGLKRTADQDREERGQLFDEIQRCMMRKHYEYISRCDNSVTEKFPACRARKGEPWE